MSALETVGLVHDYGARRALDGVSLAVGEGEIFGLLGPNGSGKTTLFRVLATLLRPAGGTARVLGKDVVADAAAVRRTIGVVFQAPSLDRKLTVRENLVHQGRLYGLRGRDLEDRAAAMLERVGLDARGDDRCETLSGGLRRRAELAKGLLHAPAVLLLDEPSTGLDPGARRDLGTYLRGLEGVTALVTTHLMEEAERCDRLGILDRGRLVAVGTPDALRAEIGGDVVTLRAREPERAAALVTERFDADATVVDGRVRFEAADGAVLLPRLVEALGDRLEAATVGKPTLEDVFVKKTGHRFWTEEEA